MSGGDRRDRSRATRRLQWILGDQREEDRRRKIMRPVTGAHPPRQVERGFDRRDRLVTGYGVGRRGEDPSKVHSEEFLGRRRTSKTRRSIGARRTAKFGRRSRTSIGRRTCSGDRRDHPEYFPIYAGPWRRAGEPHEGLVEVPPTAFSTLEQRIVLALQDLEDGGSIVIVKDVKDPHNRQVFVLRRTGESREITVPPVPAVPPADKRSGRDRRERHGAIIFQRRRRNRRGQ